MTSFVNVTLANGSTGLVPMSSLRSAPHVVTAPTFGEEQTSQNPLGFQPHQNQLAQKNDDERRATVDETDEAEVRTPLDANVMQTLTQYNNTFPITLALSQSSPCILTLTPTMTQTQNILNLFVSSISTLFDLSPTATNLSQTINLSSCYKPTNIATSPSALKELSPAMLSKINSPLTLAIVPFLSSTKSSTLSTRIMKRQRNLNTGDGSYRGVVILTFDNAEEYEDWERKLVREWEKK